MPNAVTKFFAVESNRAYVYRVLVALSPLLVAAGFISSGDAQTYLLVASSLLGVGSTVLAVKNTSTS